VRVLLIEDDKLVSQCISMMLTNADFEVCAAGSGEEGLDLCKVYEYDAILLDLGLPDMCGLQVLRSLRLAKVHTPVLVLSGDGIIDTKVKALNLGADDYLTKPFSRDELVARVRSIIRRSQSHAHPVIAIGKMRLDLHARSVRVQGAPLDLTYREYQILEQIGRAHV